MPAVAGPDLAAHESLLDFGARFYDPATAIFLQQDPLAEKYYNLSPYAYCANNPVNFVDPDGEALGPAVAIGLGVLVGATVSGGAAIIAGKSGSEVFAAAAGGAVDGLGVSAGLILQSFPVAGQVLGGAVINAFFGGAGEYVEQYFNMAFGNQNEISHIDAFLSAGVSCVTSAGSEIIEKSLKSAANTIIESEATANLLEKNIKKGAKSIGKKPKPSVVKNLVEAEQKEMSNAASKIIEISFKTFGYSYNFYSDIYEDTK